MGIRKSILICLTIASCLISLSTAKGIENDIKKEYRLSEKFGPWMIMVGTFSDVQGPERKKGGLSAAEAARRLVHELRTSGIPAYVFSQDSQKQSIDTYDRLGNKDKRVYKSQFDMICVLAGNYESIDDKNAQKTLTIVKKFRPKFMSDPKSGAIVREVSSKQKGPFGSAFMTINPMLKPEEVVRRQVDSDTKYFNSGIDHALVGVKHKYTLRVATFAGKSLVADVNSKQNGKEANFDKSLLDSGPYNLARAGEDAMQLTYAMRQTSPGTRKLGRDRFESYVYHDKFQSYVTVGGFDSKDDPEIARLAQLFMAKYKPADGGDYNLEAESLSLPNRDPSLPPVQTWAFDPIPELIEIPRLR